jgi:DNA-binding NtrC family response regulator
MSVPKLRILVVDDDAEVVAYLLEQLRDDGHRAEGTSEPDEAIARIEATAYDLVVSDVEMPKQRGFDLMKEIHRKRPGQLVLLITAFGSIDTAVKALHAGACDFVTKPFRYEDLQLAILRAVRERGMRREIVRLRAAFTEDQSGIVAQSPAMRRVVELCNRAAASVASVLLTGESGVGKGLLARLLHDCGPRASGPFVQVNCATLPTALAESELFGVRRGAYTDAVESRPGRTCFRVVLPLRRSREVTG